MNWKWVFLSFRGRLSPKQFSRASSILLVSYLIVWDLSLSTGETFWSRARDFYSHVIDWDLSPTTGGLDKVNDLACLAFGLATIWPLLAVCIKRLHDSERTVLFAIPVALSWLLLPAWWLIVDSGAIVIPSPYAAIISAIILVALVLSVEIHKFGGAAGANPFGPEPSDAKTTKEDPVMLPFRNKDGTGWHVMIRYHAGHERRIDGFAAESEALVWIVANAREIDKQPQ